MYGRPVRRGNRLGDVKATVTLNYKLFIVIPGIPPGHAGIQVVIRPSLGIGVALEAVR